MSTPVFPRPSPDHSAPNFWSTLYPPQRQPPTTQAARHFIPPTELRRHLPKIVAPWSFHPVCATRASRLFLPLRIIFKPALAPPPLPVFSREPALKSPHSALQHPHPSFLFVQPLAQFLFLCHAAPISARLCVAVERRL